MATIELEEKENKNEMYFLDPNTQLSEIDDEIHFEEDNEEDNEEEWLDYLSSCEEWKEMSYEEWYEEKSLFQNCNNRKPIIINRTKIEQLDEYMVCLGKPKQRVVKKKQSFKYNIGLSKNIFCNSLIKPNIKCEKKNKCRYAHTFEEIPKCHNKCSRIVFKNNFYSGVCSKRHEHETIDNFLIRKNINLLKCKIINIEFFHPPPKEFIETILQKSKNICEKLNISIVKKTKTLEEYLKERALEKLDMDYKYSNPAIDNFSSQEFNTIISNVFNF